MAESRETVKLVITARGPVEVYPGTRCKVVGYEHGKPVTQDFPIVLAEWRGLKASGCTEEEAIKKVQEGR